MLSIAMKGKVGIGPKRKAGLLKAWITVMKPLTGKVSQIQVLYLAAVCLALNVLGYGVSEAFTAPAAGSFGYDIYDLVVNSILKGAIGFVGALCLIVWGATQITKNWMVTILCLIAGTVLIKADAIVTTLGALI